MPGASPQAIMAARLWRLTNRGEPSRARVNVNRKEVRRHEVGFSHREVLVQRKTGACPRSLRCDLEIDVAVKLPLKIDAIAYGLDARERIDAHDLADRVAPLREGMNRFRR